jgi:flavin-dependent thymidylate synthase
MTTTIHFINNEGHPWCGNEEVMSHIQSASKAFHIKGGGDSCLACHTAIPGKEMGDSLRIGWRDERLNGGGSLPARLADVAMFERQKFGEVDPGMGVVPQVYLVSATPDPLGAMAAMNEMYRGNIIKNRSELPEYAREQAWKDCQATHLKAPMESIDFMFMIEGVDRAITHQIVRQRTAVYAQESMRFAMPSELTNETSLPPSLWGTEESDPLRSYVSESPEEIALLEKRRLWDETLRTIAKNYQKLIDQGMPAEEARGLLPHATCTRLMYKTNLRNLVEHAGNRLCTQAQFHWRLIFNGIVQAIRTFDSRGGSFDNWQFKMIADSALFRPICYQTGKCEFMGSADRFCSIRSRVTELHNQGISPSLWESGDMENLRIDPMEWLVDDGAARRRQV